MTNYRSISLVLILMTVRSLESLSRVFLSTHFTSATTGYTSIHCHGSEYSCLSKMPGIKLSCRQSCICQGFFFGICERDEDFCKPVYPIGCKCKGYWFGIKPDFCKMNIFTTI